ncbi:MAG: hypothetical protein ACR2PL_05005 [Dehalococcoidia bacterium]
MADGLYFLSLQMLGTQDGALLRCRPNWNHTACRQPAKRVNGNPVSIVNVPDDKLWTASLAVYKLAVTGVRLERTTSLG